MKSTNLRLQFGMERKTFFATNEKVRNYRSDDIGLYILSKLPLKSLKRFECVHRAWSLLYKNTHFMNMFLNNFLFNLNCCSYYYGASLLYSYSWMNPIIKMFFYSLYFPLANQFDFRIFGVVSINDILSPWIWSFGRNYTVEPDYRGNQGILSQVELIESSILDDATIFFVGNDATNSVDVCIFFSNLHGFGYDHVINDYKVV